MENYLKSAYALYTDLIKVHKKYALEHSQENIIVDINAINDKYQANYCNALTDALRRWKQEMFYGALTNDEIKAFYTDIWKLHKKYAADKLSSKAGEYIKESALLSEKYSGDPYKRNRPVESILVALADEIENPTLRG